MNFWTENYKSITELLYISIGLFYFYHAISNIISYQIIKSKAIVFNTGMCFLAAMHCLSFFIPSYFESVTTLKEVLIPFVYFTSAGSLICYIYLLKEYFNQNFKVLTVVAKILLFIILIFILDTINHLLGGTYIFFEDIGSNYTTYYGELNAMPKKLNSLGKMIFMISTLASFPATVFLLRWIRKNHPEEKLLVVGLWVSILTTIHDTFFATGMLYYSMTCMYLAYALEALRFTYHYQREAFIRAQRLELEVQKISKTAYIGQLVSSIFHDIRNPLSILSMQNRMMRKMAEKDDSLVQYEKNNEIINKNILRINEIIDSYMGIIYQEKKNKPSAHNLSFIVDEAIKLSHHKIRIFETLVVNNVNKSAMLKCYPSDMTLVITNLILNSCDAIQELDIEQKSVQIYYYDNMIKVVDSGLGIPDEIKESIFKMQFTTKEAGQGTGLGLGIVKEVLKKMDYEIYIEKEAKNTTFVIRENDNIKDSEDQEVST